MRYFPKIAIGFLILIFTILIILFSAAFLMQDKVTGFIIGELNRNLSTKIETGPARLSFIKSFPKATVILKHVLVHSSPGFNPADFNGIDTDTLLYAKSALLVLRPLDILRGKYDLEMIILKSGNCRFLSDKSGNVNYTISSTGNNSQNPVTINLRKVFLSDICASYHNTANNTEIMGFIESGTLKSRISGDNIDFTAGSDLRIDSLRLGGIDLNSHLQSKLDLRLNSTKEGITFSKSSLKIDNYDFTVEGTVSSTNFYNLLISGDNIDLKDLGHYIPKKYAEIIGQYDPSGNLIAECRINGQWTRTLNPHVEIKVGLNNGSIVYRKTGESIRKISFTGNFSNGSRNKAESGSVSVSDLKFTLGSSEYSGAFQVKNLVKPHTEVSLAGKVNPAQVRDFFGITGLPVAAGSVDVDLKFKSDHPLKEQFTRDNFIDHLPEGSLFFDSFSLGGTDEKTVFRQVNGSGSISDRYIAKNLTFNYRGHHFGVSGEFRNLVQWLTGRHVTLVADAEVSLDHLVTGAETGTFPEKPSAMSFPSDMILNLKFRIDSVRYKTFSSEDVTGMVTYKPRLLTFKSLNMKALDGFISGDGFIAGNSNRSIISRGDFKVNNIDVKKAFISFSNFGQKFIVSDNLSGLLSGTISILMPMDSMFVPKAKNVTAEGRYTLVNGALINFEPVKQLSSFIELSELQNIHFQKLENDFFIRNNILFIPQMEVRSTAADLTVSGQHSFENNYEYHVRMLLSELLSKKRMGMKKPVTEFGAVQDDGLGRTSILLKVVNKGEDVKVGYDLKAAGAVVKNNIRNEKKNLKTLLNEEYGWYQDEAGKTTTAKPAAEKKKFRVTWDGNDSVPSAPAPEQDKEGGFRSLFRKK